MRSVVKTVKSHEDVSISRQTPKIICVGLNYRDHTTKINMPLPESPVLFAKYPSSIAGNGDVIPIPDFVEHLDFEAELGMVIGKPGKRISARNALSHVRGYVAANDISARDIQGHKGNGCAENP